MDPVSKLAARALLRENVSLDFINPVVAGSEADWYFRSYDTLVDWGAAAGTLGETEAATLRSTAGASKDTAARALGRARSARATLDAVLRAAATGGKPHAYLAELGDLADAAFSHRRLSAHGGRVTWDWPFDGDSLSMLWPVVPAAIDLLMSPEASLLKVCPGCGWLFVDRSKNHTRKWCRMSDCGNLAKVRSHRERGRA